MRKFGIINPEIIKAISKAGHTDLILICDAGLPLPDGVKVIDLSFKEGQIPFMTVLKGLLEELVVEKIIITEETEKNSKNFYDELCQQIKDINTLKINHEKLKEMSKDVNLIIRTGEFTPYANIILQAGVPF